MLRKSFDIIFLKKKLKLSLLTDDMIWIQIILFFKFCI